MKKIQKPPSSQSAQPPKTGVSPPVDVSNIQHVQPLAKADTRVQPKLSHTSMESEKKMSPTLSIAREQKNVVAAVKKETPSNEDKLSTKSTHSNRGNNSQPSVSSQPTTSSGVSLDAVITRNPSKYHVHRSLGQMIKGTILGFPAFVIHLPRNAKNFVSIWLISIISFIFLLFLYLVDKIFSWILLFPLLPKEFRTSTRAKLAAFFITISSGSRKEERTINRMNLIDLAIRNMLFKRSRAIITVGGMAIGIAAIVFLVSIGFGLQQLVLSRVARLDELLQADVSPLPGSKEKINDGTMAKVKDIDSVKEVLPIISSVAKVTFNNSESDMAVYGVTSDFLNQSAIKPTRGKIFDSNELSQVVSSHGEVAGIFDEVIADEQSAPSEEKIGFSIDEEQWVKVRKSPDRNAEVVGYTRRTAGEQYGSRVWGGQYAEAKAQHLEKDGQAPWIEGTFALWKSEDEQDQDKDETNTQRFEKGYIAQVKMTVQTINDQPVGVVLGETTDASDEAALVTDEIQAAINAEDPNSQWVTIASESAAASTEKVTKKEISPKAKKEAVVNTAMLKILGLNEDDAIGKSFQSSFIIVGDLLENSEEKIESYPADYTIIGIIPEDKTPYFYVPFWDLRSLGVSNYSQLKIVVNEKSKLAEVRKKVETLGFSTRSVADTVKQIDQLFTTARTVLMILGLVALAVAALGMFNTLTVSLLERTREVGLMKAMGMKSHEVQELFLTESMVMGFFGGILGIVMGFCAGKALGVFLSIYSVTRGAGYIDISHLPSSFVGFIFLLSLLVGVFTGVYPARRATRISALDALRYE